MLYNGIYKNNVHFKFEDGPWISKVESTNQDSIASLQVWVNGIPKKFHTTILAEDGSLALKSGSKSIPSHTH